MSCCKWRYAIELLNRFYSVSALSILSQTVSFPVALFVFLIPFHWFASEASVYSLLLCGLFYEAICFMSYLVSFCSGVFSPFSIAITSLGEERANLSAFRTFVRFVLVWICRFPLPLGVWEGLRFVAFPGPFIFLHSSSILSKVE